MDTNLRSAHISLQFGDGFTEFATVNRLWETFRRTALEPGQSSSPDFASFGDECLFCAQIVTSVAAPPTDENTRDSLWDASPTEQRWSGSSSTPFTAPSPPTTRTIGLIYLCAGPANVPSGEANIGVIMDPSMQHRGYAREAVHLVLRWAFEELKFHRVQAAILDTPSKDRALRLFIGSGFAHEGTKRRAVYQPEGDGMVGLWKDVTYLAMLDTEWMLKSTWMRTNRAQQPPVASVWDEMFARHTREREELLRWEEKQGRIRKSPSTETLREHTRNAVQNMGYLTDDASSVTSSSPPSPRLNVVVNWEDDAHMADDLGPDELHQTWEDVVETSFATRRHRQRMENSSVDPSLRGQMLALPSIPSASLRLSEGDLQSPLTIPTHSSPASTPPHSPSPAPSSVHNTWPDSEDEDNWLPTEDFTPTHVPLQFTTPQDPYPRAGPSRLRTRSRSSSVSSSSTDSWSDAQSSAAGSSSSWDVV